MSISKPFHRNYRGMKPGPNAGFSDWAYIADPEYAKGAVHYVRAFLLIQADLKTIFEYIEPSDEAMSAFSYRIHALFLRACVEIEANFKAILSSNIFSASMRNLTLRDYRRIDVTHHLSSYEVTLQTWSGNPKSFKPFSPWFQHRGLRVSQPVPLPWYTAYNASKHDRHDEFRKANFGNLLEAVAALLILLSSQFRDEDFSPGPLRLSLGNSDHQMYDPALGELFRIQFPKDWSDDELYDFDWSTLKNNSHRFEKIDYDAIMV